MGKKKPKLGMKPPPGVGMADALFTRTQQAVLGALFGQPDRSFFAGQLIRELGMGSGAVQRELARLEQSGLVTMQTVGNQKHYRADPKSPLFAELASIAQKTFGIAYPLREALASLAPEIKAAFVFGSVAKRSDTAISDIDLMIISEKLTYADVFEAVEPAAQRLARTINPTIQTPRDWTKRLKEDNAFHARISKQPKIWLFGSEDDLAA